MSKEIFQQPKSGPFLEIWESQGVINSQLFKVEGGEVFSYEKATRTWGKATMAHRALVSNIRMFVVDDDADEATRLQPSPVGGGENVLHRVIDDLEARSEMGMKKYGAPLTAHNGHNSLIDAYQEVLDLAMYLKQRIMEDGYASA